MYIVSCNNVWNFIDCLQIKCLISNSTSSASHINHFIIIVSSLSIDRSSESKLSFPWAPPLHLRICRFHKVVNYAHSRFSSSSAVHYSSLHQRLQRPHYLSHDQYSFSLLSLNFSTDIPSLPYSLVLLHSSSPSLVCLITSRPNYPTHTWAWLRQISKASHAIGHILTNLMF